MANDWTTPPTIGPCPQCGDWTFTGSMISGRRITLSMTSFTPATFAAWASKGRRPLYVVVNGGVGLVRAGDGTRMADWRPEHRCPSLDVQGKAQGLPAPSAAPGPQESPRGRERAVSGLRASPTPMPGASVPTPSAVPGSSIATPATDRRSELDAAAALVIRQLGAVLIEREINDRVVYRKPE